ncbi:MAG: hypothetical protein MJ213_03890 [Bacilli bacterium]|nr:hypothetical protein [Bacilli bacterium]
MEMIKLKDLPELERPREKARHFGINKLSNIELLALIIGSGTKDMNVLMVATNLLSYAHSIDALLDFSYQDFFKISGIKEATAFRFLAISELLKRRGLSEKTINYTDSKRVAIRNRHIIGNNKNESMYLLAVDDKGSLIYEKELYVGTKQAFISSEEEIIDELKRERAHFFIIVHNHPSNQVTPSEDDLISTNHLKVRAKRNNLILLDHIIVSSGETYYSFKENDNLLK